ncbi:MAG: HPF/RaiA family ribosome-associated protein, partial [Chloroflexi bacterium]|nr:HPF/RaiA family ribosome-associated protein [Chloroflexota bacterium]
MDIIIHAKNIELNPEAEQYIQRKFSRLQRHLKTVSDAKIEVSRTSVRSKPDLFVAQMTLAAGSR